jgi:putative colanic acid biosynthesis acetyltransferase WcaF
MTDTAAPLSAPSAYAPVQTTPFSLGQKVKIRVWAVINSTVFRWSPFFLRGFRRALLSCFGAQISNTASIHNTARIDCPWNLVMGERASIGEHAWVYTLDRIEIGDHACVGQRVTILTGSHDTSDPNFPMVLNPVRVGRGSWIAVNVTVLPGAHIGDYAVIGAGSVVTKPMPEKMICAGNPCRPLKPRLLPI